MGIGAGWNEPEYRATGLTFDPPGTRIERMTEAIAILRGLFADGPFSFAGRFYTIDALDGQPKPVQRPHRRSSSAGRGSAWSGWRPARRTSSGSTCARTGRRILDAFAARTDVRVGWVREEAGDRVRAGST